LHYFTAFGTGVYLSHKVDVCVEIFKIEIFVTVWFCTLELFIIIESASFLLQCNLLICNMTNPTQLCLLQDSPAPNNISEGSALSGKKVCEQYLMYDGNTYLLLFP